MCVHYSWNRHTSAFVWMELWKSFTLYLVSLITSSQRWKGKKTKVGKRQPPGLTTPDFFLNTDSELLQGETSKVPIIYKNTVLNQCNFRLLQQRFRWCDDGSDILKMTFLGGLRGLWRLNAALWPYSWEDSLSHKGDKAAEMMKCFKLLLSLTFYPWTQDGFS